MKRRWLDPVVWMAAESVAVLLLVLGVFGPLVGGSESPNPSTPQPGIPVDPYGVGR